MNAVAKAGAVGIIGVYPPGFDAFPIGAVTNRNLTVQGGNCNHRRYIPGPLGRVARGDLDPTRSSPVTQHAEPVAAGDAYEQFDLRREGWLETVVTMTGSTP
ncbi:hypothetical protein [Nocardia grenadensis]|uniref:hypothetical protein n=1 Tax=Nocardia grenadensis TaxID=931537 RepID=UPI0007A524AC|nr:hypothetical protein [Nocardia grenadensis]